MITEIGEIRGEELRVRIYVNDEDLLVLDVGGCLPFPKHEIASTLGELIISMIAQREADACGDKPIDHIHLEPT